MFILHISWAPAMLLCQEFFLWLVSNKGFTSVNSASMLWQHRRSHSTLQTTTHEPRILKVDKTPGWKMLPLFVWLWFLILHCKRKDLSSCGAPRRFCCSLVDVAGSRLPGQASDFSHGSQTLGQSAGVLSPVTSFQAGPTRAKRAWETQSAQGPAVKLYTEHVLLLD